MNYYIADMHLFCKSQTKAGINYDDRPFENTSEMHNYVLEEWNKEITNGDTVYILGDLSLRGKNDELIALVAQLKGRKVLVKGNHDDISDYRYKQLFSEIVDYKEIIDSFDGKTYKLILRHYPILMWNGQHNGSILLYGHTHSTEEDGFFQSCIAMLFEFLKLKRPNLKRIRAINVGCMKSYMNYKPRTLRGLLASCYPDEA